jgi:hypothetical protein
MSSAPTQPKSEISTSLIYYQKPTIGNERGIRSPPPVQLAFPGHGFGLGIPVKEVNDSAADQSARENSFGILASGPENTGADLEYFRALQTIFIVLGLFNIVISGLLIGNADVVDVSKVVAKTSPSPEWFQAVPENRRRIENVDFAFSIIIILFGMASVLMKSCLGVSAYCLATLLNFLLGTSALPYFMYSFHYILDFAMLYAALLLRARLMFTFLPLNFRLQPSGA